MIEANTPLKVNVRCTAEYWNYIVSVKHPVMGGKEEVVRRVLSEPERIRRSRIDKDLFLYYRHEERLYCAVARHAGREGFLITAYPADKVKEGDEVWTR